MRTKQQLRTKLQGFWRDTDGAEMLEWAVVTAVLLIVTIPVILAIQDEVMLFYERIFGAMEKPPPDSFITPVTP